MTEEEHALPGDRIGRDKLEHGKHATEKRKSLSEDREGRGKSEHKKEATERGALTSWRRRREG